jgi:urease accessory protein UreE
VQILSTAFQISQKVEKRYFQAVKPGFSLVELMVYVTLFAVASIGISTLYLMLQKHHIEVNQLGEYEGQKDYAHNLLKVRLKNSDSVKISNVRLNDSACLELTKKFSTQRTGIRFDGAGRTIESLQAINITDASARSISFWVKAEKGQATENVILRWGETNARQFAVVLRNGYLYVQLEGALLGSNNGINFFDDAWHHVVITFPDEAASTVVNGNLLKQYIDGVRRDGNKFETTTTTWPIGNRFMRTTTSNLLVGARDKSGTNPFKGGISDLRIWSDVIQANEVARIYNEERDTSRVYNQVPDHNMIRFQAQVLRWPMFGIGSPQETTTFDSSSQNNPGRLHNFDTGALVSFGNRKQQNSEKFCFFDNDSDGFFELWQGADATPQNPSGNSAWTLKSKDVFVPGANGFFKSVGSSPETVTANFAIGAVVGSDVTELQKNVTSSFSNNIIAPTQALCAITPSDVFEAPTCTVNEAYAAIVEGFNTENDQLTIPARTKQKSAIFTNYSGIENLPPTVHAEWNSITGVMRFYTTDNRPQPTQIWNRAMRSVRLVSTGTAYSPNKKITFSLGEPAFEIDGKFHFYDFVPADIRPYSFTRALSRVKQIEPKMCGLQPYLTTITSAEENEFVGKASSIYGFISGWIGARETEPGNWRWINGPDNGTRIWSGYRRGYPIVDDGTPDGVATNLLMYRNAEDHLIDNSQNEMAPIWANNVDTRKMRYTNFSLGETGTDTNDFQPKTTVSHSSKRATYVAINGSARGGNLWRSATLDSAYCHFHRPATPEHERICGHYREWGGMPNDPIVKSASSVSVDMNTHNKYCKSTQ